MNNFVVRHIKTTLTLIGLSAIMLLLAISNISTTQAQISTSILYEEDFEGTSFSWTSDPYGTDTGRKGLWQPGNPEQTYDGGNIYQFENAFSGTNALITGLRAGSSVGRFDVDGGIVSILSPEIALPIPSHPNEIYISLKAYLAYTNSSADDFLRITAFSEVDSIKIFERSGSSSSQPAIWESNRRVDITNLGGESIQLLIEAADSGTGSIVEAGVDNIVITQNN